MSLPQADSKKPIPHRHLFSPMRLTLVRRPPFHIANRLNFFAACFRRASAYEALQPLSSRPLATAAIPYATVKERMTKTPIMNRRLAFLGYGACALAGSLWGTGFYFGRLALNEMSVEYMVLYRFLFASLGMLPVAFIHRRRFRLSAAETRLLLLCAFLGVPLQFLLQFHGLARTTVSHASLMVGAMPVMLAAAAPLFAGKRAHEERRSEERRVGEE